jgi:uncharacterized membrane protein
MVDWLKIALGAAAGALAGFYFEYARIDTLHRIPNTITDVIRPQNIALFAMVGALLSYTKG